eukprot:sb/3473348/
MSRVTPNIAYRVIENWSKTNLKRMALVCIVTRTCILQKVTVRLHIRTCLTTTVILHIPEAFCNQIPASSWLSKNKNSVNGQKIKKFGYVMFGHRNFFPLYKRYYYPYVLTPTGALAWWGKVITKRKRDERETRERRERETRQIYRDRTLTEI